MKRLLYLAAGSLCIVLAVIGVVLPLLPTTPFVLVAAWCFSRSSRRLHRWLITNRIFGPLILDWERHGVIPFKVKCLATTMMLVMVSYPLLFKPFDIMLKFVVVATICVALGYIWSRPSQASSTQQVS